MKSLRNHVFLNNWLFIWVFGLIHYIRRTNKDLNFIIPNSLKSFKLNDEFRIEKSVLASLKRKFGLRFALIGIWKIIWSFFIWFCAYYLLKELVKTRFSNAGLGNAHLYAALLGVFSLLATVSIQQLLFQSSRLGLQIKTLLTVQIYKKSLRLYKVSGGVGSIVNLTARDVQKVGDSIALLHYLWSSLLELVLIVVLSFITLGAPAFPTLVILAVVFPIQILLGKKRSKDGVECTQTTIERVHLTSEILTAIKLIKFYAWEVPFEKSINKIREKELRLFKSTLFVSAVNYTIVFCVPVLSTLLSIVAYEVMRQNIDPVRGFTILSLYNTMRYPLLMLPSAVNAFSDALMSLEKLDAFFNEEEADTLRISESSSSDDAIKCKKAVLYWDKEDDFRLKLDNLEIKKGSLVAVVGSVGGGKSSLLAAILNQMKTEEGELIVTQSCTYVSQEAWLLNQSVRENILFGSPYDEKRYKSVINACALSTDIEMMEHGDMTNVGERGTNLSGGQRQRLSLARGVYTNSEIILLDDPMSAVDQKVGQQMLTNCIQGVLANRTVVLVTNQLHFLEQVDHVIVMNNGEIAQQGKYEDLMAVDGIFKQMIDDIPDLELPEPVVQESVDSDDEDELKDNIFLQVPRPNMQSMTMQMNELSVLNKMSRMEYHTYHATNWAKEVERNQLSILSMTYFDEPLEDLTPAKSEKPAKHVGPLNFYMRVGAGILAFAVLVTFFFLVHAIRVLSDVFLSFWVRANPPFDFSRTLYPVIYGVLTAAFTLGVLLRGIWFSKTVLRKSKLLFANMFKHVLYARMGFFDKTPLGKILNAFASHMLAIDEQLPDALSQTLQYIPLIVGTVVLLIVVLPLSAVVFLGLAVFGLILIWFSSGVEEKLKNSEAVARSSIFNHLTVTLDGLMSIRAYKCEERFTTIYHESMDRSTEFLYGQLLVKSWFALYVDFLVSVVIYCVSLIVVLKFDSLQADRVGLIESNVLQLLVFLQWSVRNLSEIVARGSSVKIAKKYGEIDSENPNDATKRVSDEWPTEGNIKFDNVVMRYSPEGKPILKGVTVSIKAHEKVGIVGRTGSGKSTLLISLLRICELSEGKIFIDDEDISTVGLRKLRSKIAIIPQEPVLFVGSIRHNIDPFEDSTDEEIWNALDSVNLKGVISGMPNKLESLVIENGKNFSLGQRQLFCIARAILTKANILVLDEATAAIDHQTDQLIQSAIKQNFSSKTVLTIAHRLNTVMKSDKILVMDAGVPVEFDAPEVLLGIEGGHFYSLANQKH